MRPHGIPWLSHANSVYGQFLRAAADRTEREEADRLEWIDGLAEKYGVIRLAESLTAEQQARQYQWVEFRLGHRFLTTIPHMGMSYWGGTWHLTGPL